MIYPPHLCSAATLPAENFLSTGQSLCVSIPCAPDDRAILQRKISLFIPPVLWLPNSPDLKYPVDYRVRGVISILVFLIRGNSVVSGVGRVRGEDLSLSAINVLVTMISSI